ncbi:hypothetical protein HN014_04105 [Aquimarina sp. TRL1]|uniref:hypothetical protein n=1 Tax=Aquimarina sp. (strain TRL1) TaxID=2736252 RepID=UPI00158F5FB3|nr:hypothetical protein [Aquimarina sp. TRL1]QKX04121.1 hypothetical protein HN014_04105 [Aquimarina sp. TRL1]
MLRDRIQKQVYPNRKNTATILNYLEELVLINAKEVGLVPIKQCDKGYQDVPLPFGRVTSLDVPEEAVSATMMVEKGKVNISIDCDPDKTVSIEATTKKSVNRRPIPILELLVTDSSAVVRFKENGSSPSINSGFGLGNQDIFELVGKENLKRFKVIGVQDNGTPILRIQFYKTAQFE